MFEDKCMFCGYTGFKYWLVEHVWGLYHICGDKK